MPGLFSLHPRVIMQSMSARLTWILFGTVVLLGAVGAWFFFVRPDVLPLMPAAQCTKEAKICPDGTSVARSGPKCEFASCPAPVYNWILSDTSLKSQNGAPLINVSLSLGGKEHRIGTFEGSCGEIGDEYWPLFEGEQAGAACWFGRSGVELGVFEEQGRLVLKKAPLTEGSTDAEIVRGTFETILELSPFP